MNRLISAIRRLRGALKKIGKLDLRKDQRVSLQKAYFWTFFLKRYDSRNKIANIAGRRIKFSSYEHLYYLFREIFIDRSYYFKTENKTPFIVDCGSNIGMSVLYFGLLHPDSEIIGFEPNAVSFRCLAHNVEENQLARVKIHQKALFDSEGQVDLYYSPSEPTSGSTSIFRERMNGKKQTVETTLLSKYIDRKVDFLKMDVEGAELAVIRDLSSAGKLTYVQQMIMEYHHHIIADLDEFSEILQLLERAGFGYQIGSGLKRPSTPRQFQDITVYAYQKKSQPAEAGHAHRDPLQPNS